jgi:hypothetical protein
MLTPFAKFTLYLQIVYYIIVLFCLVSISKPYHLAVQILFYIVNGFFIGGYLWFEIYNWMHKGQRGFYVEPKALTYTRTLGAVVIISLSFSAFSGYKSFSSFYSYNVKSHLFLFVSMMMLFVLKFKLIFGFQLLAGHVVSYFLVLAFIGVIVIYFEEK